MNNNDGTKEEEKSFSIKDHLYSVKMDGKMALVSLYDDLPHFEYDTTIDNLKKSNKKLNIFVKELEQLIRKLEKENSELKKMNLIASKNIVSLYKTATSEIKRKDIIINELRNSEFKLQSRSKMFPSSKLQFEDTQFNKLSNRKQDALQNGSTEKKSIMQNQNNSENVSNISIVPNNDVPKTIYYKRMCQKLTNKNKNTITKSNTTKYENNNCTTTSKTSPNKNVCLNDENYILRESKSLSPYNEFQKINSTQIICEPDIVISDNELNTPSVTQCENSKKGKKNNTFISSFSSMPKPKEAKKKFVSVPSSISIKNMSNSTSQCIEKLCKNTNLEIKLVNTMINPPKNKLVQTQGINNTESILFRENFSTKINSVTNGEKFLKTDMNIIHKPLVFTAENNNQTPSLNIEMEQVSYRKKMEKNDTTKEKLQATCVTSSVLNNLNTKENLHKCLSMKNEKESSRQPMEKNNQLVCPLNDTNECSSKNLAVKMDFSDKISLHSKNIEVDQMPITKKTVVTGTNVKKCIVKRPLQRKRNSFVSSDTNDLNLSPNGVKCLSTNNEKESLSQLTEKNNQLECPLNDIVTNSSKNFVVDDGLTDTISVHLKSNNQADQVPTIKNTAVLGIVKKATIRRPSQNKRNSFVSSDINDLNSSPNRIKCLFTTHEKESLSQPTKKNNQLVCPLNDTNESAPENLAVKMNFADKTSIHSKNIEFDQMPITKNAVVTGTVVKMCSVKKPLRDKINSSESSDNNINLLTNSVKCTSTNNAKESPSHPTKKNNQLECPLNDTVKNSPKNSAVKEDLTDKKISEHSKNNNRVDRVLTIKTEVSGNVFKKGTVKRCSRDKRNSFVSSDINDQNLSPNRVKCLSINNENKSSSQPMVRSVQLKCQLNDIVKSFPKSSAVEMDFADKIRVHSENTELGLMPILKNTATGINDTVQVTKIGSRIKRNNSYFSVADDVKLPIINLNHSSINNEQLSSQSKQINNQLELKLNEISQSSPNKAAFEENHMSDIIEPFGLNEVKQSPFRKRKVILRNNFFTEIKARESVCPFIDDELNKYTKNVSCVSPPKSIISDRVCSNVSSDENNRELKKRRRVKLITIQDHYSKPLPSFNGAKKTEIDVSKTSVHIEKVVESSSRFYVPQAKRRKYTNFNSSDS